MIGRKTFLPFAGDARPAPLPAFDTRHRRERAQHEGQLQHVQEVIVRALQDYADFRQLDLEEVTALSTSEAYVFGDARCLIPIDYAYKDARRTPPVEVCSLSCGCSSSQRGGMSTFEARRQSMQ